MPNFLVEKYQRRVYNSLAMYNKFEEGSWGHEYWGDVLKHNLDKLNEHTEQGAEYENLYRLQ